MIVVGSDDEAISWPTAPASGLSASSRSPDDNRNSERRRGNGWTPPHQWLRELRGAVRVEQRDWEWPDRNG